MEGTIQVQIVVSGCSTSVFHMVASYAFSGDFGTPRPHTNGTVGFSKGQSQFCAFSSLEGNYQTSRKATCPKSAMVRGTDMTSAETILQ